MAHPGEERPPLWIERGVLPFVREPMLWPVLFVLVAHAAAFLGALLLLGLRDGSTADRAGLLVSAAASLPGPWLEWRARGRAGAVSSLTAVSWSLAAALAWVADRYHVF